MNDIERLIHEHYPDKYEEVKLAFNGDLNSLSKFIYDVPKWKKIIDHRLSQRRTKFDEVKQKIHDLYGEDDQKCNTLINYFTDCRSNEAANRLSLIYQGRNDDEMKRQFDYIYEDINKKGGQSFTNEDNISSNRDIISQQGNNRKWDVTKKLIKQILRGLFYFSTLTTEGQQLIHKLLPFISLEKNLSAVATLSAFSCITWRRLYQWRWRGEFCGRRCAAKVLIDLGSLSLGYACGIGTYKILFSEDSLWKSIASVVMGLLGSVAGDLWFEQFVLRRLGL